MKNNNELPGVYIHIPFCVRKCAYCDFLSFPSDDDTREKYAKALCREIKTFAGVNGRVRVDSVFIGGGTPSVMKAEQLQKVMDTVRECFILTDDAEITMEMNPGTVTDEILTFAAGNLTRASVGVQSADDDLLRKIGRIHTFSEAEETVRRLCDAGIGNINADMIRHLPGQTEEGIRRELEKVLALPLTHISLYDLIIEDGTRLAEELSSGRCVLPSEEEEEKIDRATEEMLRAAGFERYEISNHAKKGYKCRHNEKYWTGALYAGFGLGASSLWETEEGLSRYSNTPSLEKYLKNCAEKDGRELLSALREDVTYVTEKSAMEEFFFLGLRRTEGVRSDTFAGRFGHGWDDPYGDVIRRNIERGLLREKKDGDIMVVSLTERGLEVANAVMAEFVGE